MAIVIPRLILSGKSLLLIKVLKIAVYDGWDFNANRL